MSNPCVIQRYPWIIHGSSIDHPWIKTLDNTLKQNNSTKLVAYSFQYNYHRKGLTMANICPNNFPMFFRRILTVAACMQANKDCNQTRTPDNGSNRPGVNQIKTLGNEYSSLKEMDDF